MSAYIRADGISLDVPIFIQRERKADGKWFVVTASWNDPDANVETGRLVGLVTRLLALAARAPHPAPGSDTRPATRRP